MNIEAGRLRHRVTLQRPEVLQDTHGDIINTWRTVATVWAAVEPLSAREFIAARSIQSKADTRITVRYRADVQPDWRIVFRRRLYNIEGVLPDKDSGFEYLTIPASSGVSVDGQ